MICTKTNELLSEKHILVSMREMWIQGYLYGKDGLVQSMDIARAAEGKKRASL